MADCYYLKMLKSMNVGRDQVLFRGEVLVLSISRPTQGHYHLLNVK